MAPFKGSKQTGVTKQDHDLHHEVDRTKGQEGSSGSPSAKTLLGARATPGRA